MKAMAKDENVVSITADGKVTNDAELKKAEVNAGVGLGDVMVRHLEHLQEGALMDRSGKLMKDALQMMVDGETDKATITITLKVSKDERDPELFVTSGKVQLKVPVPEYSSVTFVGEDGKPSNNRSKKNLKHTIK